MLTALSFDRNVKINNFENVYCIRSYYGFKYTNLRGMGQTMSQINWFMFDELARIV